MQGNRFCTRKSFHESSRVQNALLRTRHQSHLPPDQHVWLVGLIYRAEKRPRWLPFVTNLRFFQKNSQNLLPGYCRSILFFIVLWRRFFRWVTGYNRVHPHLLASVKVSEWMRRIRESLFPAELVDNYIFVRIVNYETTICYGHRVELSVSL